MCSLRTVANKTPGIISVVKSTRKFSLKRQSLFLCLPVSAPRNVRNFRDTKNLHSAVLKVQHRKFLCQTGLSSRISAARDSYIGGTPLHLTWEASLVNKNPSQKPGKLWKMETQRVGNLQSQKARELETQKVWNLNSQNPESWKPRKSETWKIRNLKSQKPGDPESQQKPKKVQPAFQVFVHRKMQKPGSQPSKFCTGWGGDRGRNLADTG